MDFFAQILAKMNFSGKKRLGQFLNTPIIYDIAKNQKKQYAIPEENAELMDEWTGNRDFVGPSIVWGPKIKVTLNFPEFVSKHQNPVYSINFFVRYSQF